VEQAYHGNWDCMNDMLGDFQIDKEVLKGAKVLFAWYEYEDYSGSAFVLFQRNRKLYEVNGGHCSCYGLEGQWEEEETNVAAVLRRKHFGVNVDTVKALVELLKSQQ